HPIRARMVAPRRSLCHKPIVIHTGQSFEAHAFHPSLGNEVATGRVTVGERHVHFESEAVSLDIPLARLKVRLTEGEDERIYFYDTSDADWKIFTTDETVLDHPALALHVGNVLRRREENATRHELWLRLRLLGYVAAACAVIAWLGQLAVSAMV